MICKAGTVELVSWTRYEGEGLLGIGIHCFQLPKYGCNATYSHSIPTSPMIQNKSLLP